MIVCGVAGCERIVDTHHGGGRGWCGLHYMRWLRHGDPTVTLRGPGVLQTDNPTYRTMHNRIEQARGKAAARSCIDCGATAEQWSLQHNGNPVQGAYSLNVSDYDPRCRECHAEYDRWSERAWETRRDVCLDSHIDEEEA